MSCFAGVPVLCGVISFTRALVHCVVMFFNVCYQCYIFPKCTSFVHEFCVYSLTNISSHNPSHPFPSLRIEHAFSSLHMWWRRAKGCWWTQQWKLWHSSLRLRSAAPPWPTHSGCWRPCRVLQSESWVFLPRGCVDERLHERNIVYVEVNDMLNSVLELRNKNDISL